ncbi:MAG: DUF5667 domain-containing protein [Candidatus Beckwithbacteria bacterium]
MFKKILISLAMLMLLMTTGVGAVAESIESSKPVDYYLSYPGVLPDSPLYWLKMIRDRVQLILTSATLPKAEKLLLYADKRLGAGWTLVDGNKLALGVSTLTKAEKYLDQAVNLSQGLGETEPEKQFKNRLTLATKKHLEVLNLLKEKVSDESKEVMEEMIEGLKLKVESRGETEAEKLLEEVELGIDFGDGKEAMELVQAGTVLEALQAAASNRGFEITLKESDFGSLVESINGYSNRTDKAWIYFINGQSGTVAADKQGLNSGDLVEWKYIKPAF